MARHVARISALAACAIALATTPALPWHAQPSDAGTRIAVCPLVSKAEVKKYLPWQDMFDQMPLEEEPIGASGSSCNFPTLHVQVLPFTPRFIDELRKTGPPDPLPALGDVAYFRDNRGEYAEVFVRVGQRLLTLQADVDTTVAATRPRVIALATLYVARLR